MEAGDDGGSLASASGDARAARPSGRRTEPIRLLWRVRWSCGVIQMNNDPRLRQQGFGDRPPDTGLSHAPKLRLASLPRSTLAR